jgi:hypothetical protein
MPQVSTQIISLPQLGQWYMSSVGSPLRFSIGTWGMGLPQQVSSEQDSVVHTISVPHSSHL